MTPSTSQTAAVVPSRQEAWKIFDRIAHRYDLLNRLLSFGQDILWRSSVAKFFPSAKNQRVLDIATGTADQILSIFKRFGKSHTAIGVDMSGEMLSIGRRKILQRNLGEKTILVHGDALNLPIPDNFIDTTTITFGIRNLENVSLGLKEMHRILKTEGGR